MNNEYRYNLDHLIRIDVIDIEVNPRYTYKKKKTFLGFTIQKEGFYFKFVNESYIGIYVPKNHLLIDGVVYTKPQVRLNCTNDFTQSYYFETYDDSVDFANSLTSTGNFVITK